MALTITQAGSNSRTTSGSSVVVSSITASVGDLLIVMIAADNAGNNGASSISTTTDSASNTWTTQSTTNRTGGSSANDGVTLRITTSVLTNALSSGSVTVNFSPNTTNAAVLVWRVQPGAGEDVGVMDVGSGSAAGLSTYSVTATGVLSGATVFGAVAVESTSNNPAADSDTTNGSWSSAYTEFSSDARISSQYKTVTATGDQTFNGSLGATLDRAANWITVAPVHYRRIYLPSSGTAAISPAFAAGWEKTADADRVKAVLTKTSTAMTSVASSETSTSGVYDVLLRQYIFGPIAEAVDFSLGTVNGVIQALESNAAANMRAQMNVRVIQSDGTTVRNTPLDFTAATLADEFPTTLTGRYFPMQGATTTFTSGTTASVGDYLAIELGYRATNTSSTSYTGTLRFGDTGSTDLAYDSTTDNPPWLEFKTFFTPLRPLVTLSAEVMTATGATSPSASVAWGGSITAPALTATTGSPLATLNFSSVLNTITGSATAASPSASAIWGGSLEFAALTATASALAASAGASASASAAALSASVDSPHAFFPTQGDGQLNAELLAASGLSPEAALGTSFVLSLSPVTAAAGGPSSSIVVASTLTAAILAATVSTPDGSVVWGGSVTAGTIAAIAASPSLAIAISSTLDASLATATALLAEANAVTGYILPVSALSGSTRVPSASATWSTQLVVGKTAATAGTPQAQLLKDAVRHLVHRIKAGNVQVSVRGSGLVVVRSAPSGRVKRRDTMGGGKAP